MSVASEVGKIGGQKRAYKLTPEQRSAIASLGGKARMLKKLKAEDYARVEAAKPVNPDLVMRTWYHIPLIKGDINEYIHRAWSKRIPRAYEELLDAAMRERQIDAALRVLVTMTAMSGLAPQTREAVAHHARDKQAAPGDGPKRRRYARAHADP